MIWNGSHKLQSILCVSLGHAYIFCILEMRQFIWDQIHELGLASAKWPVHGSNPGSFELWPLSFLTTLHSGKLGALTITLMGDAKLVQWFLCFTTILGSVAPKNVGQISKQGQVISVDAKTKYVCLIWKKMPHGKNTKLYNIKIETTL